MENNNTITQPKKKIKKFLLRGTLLLIVLLSLAHFAWMFSGSNQWELVKDENGVQVYTLKSPGSVLRKNKGIVRIKFPLRHIAAVLLDNSLESCAEWMPGCVAAIPIESWNSQGLYHISLFRVNLPFPLDPREFLLKTKISQDPKTKTVLIEYIAVPDKLPENECCVRIKDMHNTWRFTPLENGEVELEVIQDMDSGGFIPYFLFNAGTPPGMHALLSGLSKLLDKEKYQDAKFDFIQEYDESSELISRKP